MKTFPGSADPEEQLRRLLAHLDTAQHVAQLGSWERDLVTGDLQWSTAVATIFGLPRGTVPTSGLFLAAVHPDDRARVRAEHEAALAGERPYVMDHRIVRPDGAVRYVREVAEIERDPSGVAVRITGVVQDRTDRVRTEEQLDRVRRQRRALLHRMLRTVDEERSRLAGALHDDPLQKLTIASLRLEHAAMTSDRPLPVADLVAGIREVIEALRDSLIELEPLTTRIAGLRFALEQLARSVVGDLDISIDVDLDDEPPEPVTRVLIRIAQEALTNVRDHAGAGRVELQVRARVNGTELLVADDGHGFDVGRYGLDIGRLGLIAMQERAAALGGSLDVDTGSSGTTVRTLLPHRPGTT